MGRYIAKQSLILPGGVGVVRGQVVGDEIAKGREALFDKIEEPKPAKRTTKRAAKAEDDTEGE